jgi:general secretion pathway protein G
MFSRLKLSGGFTLVELLLVLSIIGLLGSIVVPSYSKIRMQSNEKALIQVGYTLQVALESYALKFGFYPTESLFGSELITVLHDSGDLSQIPINPFTSKPFEITDTSGLMEYVFDVSENGYELSVYGYQNVSVIHVLTNK